MKKANDIYVHGHHIFVGTSAGFKVLLDKGNTLTDFGMLSAESKASLTFSQTDSSLIYIEDESKGIRLIHGDFLSNTFKYQVIATHNSSNFSKEKELRRKIIIIILFQFFFSKKKRCSR